MSQTHEYSLKKDFADPLSKHHTPSGFSERFVLRLTKLLRFFANLFFTSFVILYIIPGRTAHRLVGYFEDEDGIRDVNHQFADNFDKKA
ncbi:hypothetical protein GPUN_2025 [Glaciecola punicea ACAM 611]|jgi:hypothetical protein|uniref:Uncharacterized protein n=1 Tax=Glaciecola punicea ACAM 611 TaxID=1121923 RepID=H5TCW3_9ALTE|nr:alternative oxidase [Glaciecola punicea]OFA30382.1 hypothetical protein BAE46_11590 [Glaciecola punicea]GAB56140.1 hypothetical protein GPUN_2025 [Glaciecola punicea ACAM 611]